jgi:sugar lactone lactonase YvrE
VLDEDGCLWTAVNGEGFVLRLDPEGRELERVTVPAPGLTGICFGGVDGSTLFVCSAREGLSDQDLDRAPLSGAVFAIETAVHGRPLRRFRAA